MTGFSAQWLALREPADARARAPEILDAAVGVLADADAPLIVDLACGTGSSLRALSPHLGNNQRWRLVDHDPVLLERARAECAGFSGIADLQTVATDLAAGPGSVLGDADLVTTSAFLDLVSHDWALRFVAALSQNRLPFYASLTYDGRMGAEPSHPLDETVTDLVNRHQRQDKGFGPALGPHAVERVCECLENAGFRVSRARSDWICRTSEPIFQRELVEGWSKAAEEIGGLASNDLEAWREFRLDMIEAGSSRIRVGHEDLFAVPE
ncbi:methyltransferase family protein [Breoghania corrubedonensis]|uniref:Methyltransferase family protein n=1 Tax=Breoghania corrubedonensis TaxID=665038 RepID=A0A2T5VFB6_9HYPH|nr:class I SAM-dependent methyltransferase [Breoghania corrubedonensis]PTW62444.1 methyltransferase family protein [Breoghania corrubedonensis]